MESLKLTRKTNKELLEIVIKSLEDNNQKTERLRILLEGIDGDNGMKSIQVSHSNRLDKLDHWRFWLTGGTMAAIGVIGLLSKIGVL